jgi:hypothetical protein
MQPISRDFQMLGIRESLDEQDSCRGESFGFQVDRYANQVLSSAYPANFSYRRNGRNLSLRDSGLYFRV